MLSVYKLNGSKGIFCSNQKQMITDTERQMPRAPSVVSRKYSSRNFLHKESNTPETPNPKRAVEIIKNPKWYHRVTEKTRVRDNSNNNVENEIKKMPAKCLKPGFINQKLGNFPGNLMY